MSRRVLVALVAVLIIMVFTAASAFAGVKGGTNFGGPGNGGGVGGGDVVNPDQGDQEAVGGGQSNSPHERCFAKASCVPPPK